MMDGGIFLGGNHIGNSNIVPIFAVSNLVKEYYYPANLAYAGYKKQKAEKYTRLDMPIAAPVILAFWSDEE